MRVFWRSSLTRGILRLVKIGAKGEERAFMEINRPGRRLGILRAFGECHKSARYRQLSRLGHAVMNHLTRRGTHQGGGALLGRDV
ncbi:MAG: hypothetical protein QOG73_4335, partial [Acetobacteraceae bacterium]|nr:hypothetical protein [Acetobacteraceae bacterium]